MFVPQAICEPAAASTSGGSGGLPESGYGKTHTTPNCGDLITYCDLGSLNTAAAAGLAAGLKKVQSLFIAGAARRRRELTQYLTDGLVDIAGITVYGTTDAGQRTAAVAVNAAGLTAADLSRRLFEKGITVSGGFQCAPWAHEAIGTQEHGAVRISSGYNTTRPDVDALLGALREIC